ncbi:MAG TPA: carboxylesterase family protein, partial [Solirubrobacterales bacterium]|nr:carboxylesterase family protein [Solirubrobacterales bacterium]
MDTTRRAFFGRFGTGAAALTLGAREAGAAAPSPAAKKPDDGPVLQIGDDIAVVTTEHGKVRGYVLRGVNHFLGIPYGADTSGASRFLPPQKPKSWTNVLPALWWGNSAPQNMDNRYAERTVSFRDHWNYDDVSEDCLRI